MDDYFDFAYVSEAAKIMNQASIESGKSWTRATNINKSWMFNSIRFGQIYLTWNATQWEKTQITNGTGQGISIGKGDSCSLNANWPGTLVENSSLFFEFEGMSLDIIQIFR